jgi:sugar-specific transcriptional regulator TrmB
MEIGFTEYEAKVYLALLRENPATGYQLSKESGVPRSMVYDALKRLHSRGAALETIEGRATLYQPLPPVVLLERHEAEHHQLLRDLREGLDTLYTSGIDDRVWTVNGRAAVNAYAAQILREADQELFLVLADNDLEELRTAIGDACRRGVAVNSLLTGKGTLECGRIAYHPPLESKLQGIEGTLVVVSENTVLVAGDSPYREISATITRNRDLVLIARQFVWMELFAQRVYAQLGADLLQRLEPEDREIFESLAGQSPKE